MQILPGFFLHFSSNSAHLSHIHRLFLSFFFKFRPLIRNIHFTFWSILAILGRLQIRIYSLSFCLFQLVKHDLHGYEYINDRDMLNSYINSPMVCGLWGSARTYALITVFSLFFLNPFSFNSIFWDHCWPFLTYPKIRIPFLRVQRLFVCAHLAF